MIYQITKKTNAWIAQRDATMKGKTEITLATFATLREAQARLLDFYNEDYPIETNWGLARCHNDNYTWSHKDGTRGYEYDSRYYNIEEVDLSQMLRDYHLGGNTDPTDIVEVLGGEPHVDTDKVVSILADMDKEMSASTGEKKHDKIITKTEKDLARLI